ARDLSSGLRRGSDAAYQAVMRPVEGTILTVIREAAEAVEALEGDPTLAMVLERAYDAACDAVERTPQLLKTLRDAGVVDAGGKGFTPHRAALLERVAGRAIPEPDIVTTPASVSAHLAGDDLSSLRYE